MALLIGGLFCCADRRREGGGRPAVSAPLVVRPVLPSAPEFPALPAPRAIQAVDLAYQPGVTEESVCPICFAEYGESDRLLMLACTHAYHAECILAWAAKKPECPICRRSVVC